VERLENGLPEKEKSRGKIIYEGNVVTVHNIMFDQATCVGEHPDPRKKKPLGISRDLNPIYNFMLGLS
jgi:hypothetical protein